MKTFKKHEYTVECKCGYTQTNNDDHIRDDIVLVKVSFCERCCPLCAGNPIQLLYDKNGDRHKGVNNG